MKRTLAVLLAGILSLSMLAGCSKKDPETPEAPADPEISAPEAPFAGDPATSDAPADPDSSGDPATPDAPGADDPDTPPAPTVPAPPDLPAPEDDQEGEYGVEDETPAPAPDTPANQEPGSHKPSVAEQLHITVGTVSISEAELKAKDYTVPVVITLDKNPGITYSEWGLKVDPRCTFTAETTRDMVMKVIYSINDEKHFIWTAWGSGDPVEDTGAILCINMKLPGDAKAGDIYALDYSSTSMADKGHMFSSNENDFTEAVGWTNGGVKVTK